MSYSKKIGLGYQGPSIILLVIAVRYASIFLLSHTRIWLLMLLFDSELRQFVLVDGFPISFRLMVVLQCCSKCSLTFAHFGKHVEV